jgi:hypothetical protein
VTLPDPFSDHAEYYEANRPTYPDALFTYFASLVPRGWPLVRQPRRPAELNRRCLGSQNASASSRAGWRRMRAR